MTDTAERTTPTDAVAEVNAWLQANWDPDLTVAEWWERLGVAGWAAPGLPLTAYGRGLNRNDSVAVQNAIAEFGALGAPGGLGLLLAAPTIAAHGTQEQIDLYVRDIVTGQKAWCQLFSEPGAGSDLAGLQTRGVKDGEEWVFTGQKVWTSAGQVADLGMLIARTDPDVPKHQGISYFALDMHQPVKVEIRPLVEMTGHAMFNEVFMEEATAPDSALIGGLNNGWAVANTTLMNERAGLGSGGGHAAAGAATPGTIVNDLAKRAGDFVSDGGKKRNRPGSGGGMFAGSYKLLVDLAKGNGKNTDATIRQDLVKLHTLNELGRFNNLRAKAAKAAGLPDIPGLPNISKLSMSEIVRAQRDVGLRILGPLGTLHAYKGEDMGPLAEATGNPFAAMVTGMSLFAQAPPIYGGTDQVQKNIIGERVLGLPKEANNDKTAAFKDLPKNACEPVSALDPVDALFSGSPEVGWTDALLVQRGGEVVLERYGDDVDASTTLRSWSMAKSMLHAVVGMLVADGRLDLDAPAPVAEWADPADPRHAITLRRLLEMRPGLEWVEVYLVDQPSHVVEMLFGGPDLTAQPDVAAYAAAKPLTAEPGAVFNYSSGTSNIVSGIVRDVVGSGDAYLELLRERLFGPLGMTSADPKLDEVGTWIASSYCFCTAREFASFGQLYLDGGVRDGARLLAEDWVATASTPLSRDAEGKSHSMHWWQLFPSLPGSFNAAGYEGQYIVVVPSADLVAVRLGQTTAERNTVEDHLAGVIRSFS